MKLRNIVNNDEYLKEKKEKVIRVGKYIEHQWVYLLAILFATLLASLTGFASLSYFNTNKLYIEANAIADYPRDINDVTMESKINDGMFPNDIFASPNEQIVYLQEQYPNIKTYKEFRAYETYRGTDMVNGFYYKGNPADKPESTYTDDFDESLRIYTDFLCIDDGTYLNIDLEYSANPVTIEMKDDEGNVISSRVEYRYLEAYSGNEIYLPYEFASETLLPAYQNGYLGSDPDMTLEDLIDKEIVLFSALADRFAVEGYPSGITETPKTYIIKGIVKGDIHGGLRNRFIVPFATSMLTQPHIRFFASEDPEENIAYMKTIDSFNSNTSIKWGIYTRFTFALDDYISANVPAKRAGIYMSITLLIMVLDGFIYYLYLRNVRRRDKDKGIRYTIISSIVMLFLATMIGGLLAKIINGTSLFAWATSMGNIKTVFFSTLSSFINFLLGIIVIGAAIIASIKYLKYYQKKEINEEETKE